MFRNEANRAWFYQWRDLTTDKVIFLVISKPCGWCLYTYLEISIKECTLLVHLIELWPNCNAMDRPNHILIIFVIGVKSLHSVYPVSGKSQFPPILYRAHQRTCSPRVMSSVSIDTKWASFLEGIWQKDKFYYSLHLVISFIPSRPLHMSYA